jgi:hypothetical protein
MGNLHSSFLSVKWTSYENISKCASKDTKFAANYIILSFDQGLQNLNVRMCARLKKEEMD